MVESGDFWEGACQKSNFFIGISKLLLNLGSRDHLALRFYTGIICVLGTWVRISPGTSHNTTLKKYHNVQGFADFFIFPHNTVHSAESTKQDLLQYVGFATLMWVTCTLNFPFKNSRQQATGGQRDLLDIIVTTTSFHSTRQVLEYMPLRVATYSICTKDRTKMVANGALWSISFVCNASYRTTNERIPHTLYSPRCTMGCNL